MNVRGVVEVDRMTRGQGRGFRILKRLYEVVQGDGKIFRDFFWEMRGGVILRTFSLWVWC